jgi:hypothetical protein
MLIDGTADAAPTESAPAESAPTTQTQDTDRHQVAHQVGNNRLSLGILLYQMI